MEGMKKKKEESGERKEKKECRAIRRVRQGIQMGMMKRKRKTEQGKGMREK